MSDRPRTRVAIAFLLLALVGALAVACGGGNAPSTRYRGSPPPAGIMLPDFALASYAGPRVTTAALRGKVVVLTFLESKCRQACPVIVFQVARAVERLGPDERGRVAVLAISVQPDDDTPASVRAFLRRRHAVGRLDYLIGSEAELRPLWEEFQILSALDSGDADTHSASVRVYDRRGEWVSSLHAGIDLTPPNLVHDIRRALAGPV